MPLVRLLADQATITLGVCTLQSWRTGYTLEERTVPDHNFIYVLQGKLTWDIAGHPHLLTPGQFVIVPPQIPHRGWSTTRRVTFVSIHVDATVGGQDLFSLLHVPIQQQTRLTSRLHHYFQGAAREFSRPAQADSLVMLQSWARLVLLEMFRENAARGTLQCPAVDAVVQMMLHDIELLICQRVHLGDLARQSGYSPQHLNRLFRKNLGLTPMKYLMQRKLEYAAELLQQNVLTVSAIARKVGITDQAYFSRIFRQKFAASPADFRRLKGAEGSENPT